MPISDEKLLERRRKMLRSARHLLADVGYDNITMTGLAEAAGVTTPTLYKTFGTHEAMVFEAVADNFTDIMRDVREADSGRGLDRILGFLAVLAEHSMGARDYVRALFDAMNGPMPAPVRDIGRNVQLLVMGELHPALEEMREDGQLEGWVDVTPLAARLTTALRGAMMDWTAGVIVAERLPAAVSLSVALTLGGVTLGEARERCRRIIRENQETLAASPLAG